jgi:hypothetical protein
MLYNPLVRNLAISGDLRHIGRQQTDAPIDQREGGSLLVMSARSMNAMSNLASERQRHSSRRSSSSGYSGLGRGTHQRSRFFLAPMIATTTTRMISQCQIVNERIAVLHEPWGARGDFQRQDNAKTSNPETANPRGRNQQSLQTQAAVTHVPIPMCHLCPGPLTRYTEARTRPEGTRAQAMI